MMNGMEKIKNKMEGGFTKYQMSKFKVQTKKTMTNLKNQIPWPPKRPRQ
jgi:hypothetical protein